MSWDEPSCFGAVSPLLLPPNCFLVFVDFALEIFMLSVKGVSLVDEELFPFYIDIIGFLSWIIEIVFSFSFRAKVSNILCSLFLKPNLIISLYFDSQ